MQFVDTNIFLRHLTNDDPLRAKACLSLFRKAQHKDIRLTTSESVLAEVIYILSSPKLSYHLSPEDIRTRLQLLLALPGLILPHRKVYLRALDIYAAYHLDFEDALSIAHMERQKISEIYSYDQDFDRTRQLKRLEP